MNYEKILYWASVLSLLYGLYAALASFWPVLFARGFVKASEPDPMGYRIGLWKVHWRLRARAAILVLLLSLGPPLAAITLDGWIATLILALMTGIALILWITAPPGMIIGAEIVDQEARQPVLMPRSQRNISRAILVFLVFGLFPALGLGAVLKWILITLLVKG